MNRCQLCHDEMAQPGRLLGPVCAEAVQRALLAWSAISSALTQGSGQTVEAIPSGRRHVLPQSRRFKSSASPRKRTAVRRSDHASG